MNTQIYIFGHRNPDTDSICSSIAYSHLKKKLGFENANAYRIGKISKETQFVLDYFDIAPPPYLANTKIRLKDLDLYTPLKLSKKAPIKKAWDSLKNSNGPRIIPAVDSKGKLEGVLSSGDITNIFMEIPDKDITKRYEILFKNLVEIIDGTILAGNYNYEKIEGSIYIGSNILNESMVCDKDIVMTTKMENAKYFIKNLNVGCVFIVGVPEEIDFSNSKCAVVTSPHSLFKSVNLIHQAISIGSIMHTTNMVTLAEDNYIDDIVDVMKTSAHRNFPVVDEENRIAGVISRRHLLEYKQKQVILIDHNEKNQSVEGLEQAQIIEIIDHHRIADIQTQTPLYIRAEPVGCTATIVYKMYKENNVPIEKKIAGLLLSAIISDTLMFSSPTCTLDDEKAAEDLTEIAQISLKDYSTKMFTESTSLTGYSAEEILSIDRKRFAFSKYIVYISQVNTLDFTTITKKSDELCEAMEKYYIEKGCHLMILMITDIVLQGSEIIFVGKSKDLIMKAFDLPEGENSIFLPGIVSRKKQMVPKLFLASQNT